MLHCVEFGLCAFLCVEFGLCAFLFAVRDWQQPHAKAERWRLVAMIMAN